MSDRERVEALAEALHGLACTRHTTIDACDYEADYRADAQALAPLLAKWRAADRAEAWDEGEEAGRDNADDGYPDPLVENPYRAAALAAEPDAGGEKDARPACNWTACVRTKRADGKCFHWCRCRCHTRPTPPGSSAEPDAGGDRG